MEEIRAQPMQEAQLSSHLPCFFSGPPPSQGEGCSKGGLLQGRRRKQEIPLLRRLSFLRLSFLPPQ